MNIFIKNISFLVIIFLSFLILGCSDLMSPKPSAISYQKWFSKEQHKTFYTLEYHAQERSWYKHLCKPNILLEIEPPLLSKRLSAISPQIAFEEYDSLSDQWRVLPNAQWENKLELMLTKAFVRSIPSHCLKVTRIQNENAHFRLMSFVDDISIHSGLNNQGAKAIIQAEFWLLQMPEEQIIKTWNIKIEEPIKTFEQTQWVLNSLNQALNKLLYVNLSEILIALKEHHRNDP